MLEGESEVQFYDATSAAEMDRTEALNRDRIPRIYRKGVKEYFDRLPDRFPDQQQGQGSTGEADDAKSNTDGEESDAVGESKRPQQGSD
ncbi:MAG: hypothetical protein JXQ75_01925 [Phycisphaerae bacterium]|nr:hypothetical protein [Phycisphaerae bacterium]